MLSYGDLVRLAELIRLAAETAKLFSTAASDDEGTQITDAVSRIEIAANDLAAIGETKLRLGAGH